MEGRGDLQGKTSMQSVFETARKHEPEENQGPWGAEVVGKGLEVRLGQRVTGARQKVNLISQNSLLFKRDRNIS